MRNGIRFDAATTGRRFHGVLVVLTVASVGDVACRLHRQGPDLPLG
ncbi:MAG TPA: hypothetical protein VFR67_06510 [Pilimelia sp.]|nr:hypothetical protein [Pilimelia sp.]